MLYAKRAALLKARRGSAPLLIGDAAASSTTIINHETSFWGTVATAVFNASLGAALLAAAEFVFGYSHRLNVGEARMVYQARRLDVDLDAMSSNEIEARLRLPSDAVASTISVLTLPETPEPDMRWMGYIDGQPLMFLPSRIEALRALTDFIASAPPAVQSRRLDDLQINAALTERARSIIEPLRQTRPLDGLVVGQLVPKLLSLPSDQLRALEDAGFPAIPRDADRQAIYQLLPKLNDRSASFVWQFVSGPAKFQQAVIGISPILRWKSVDRALGALRDGDPATLAAVSALPSACTASTPSSCSQTSR